jgi:hypothetical protein
MLIDENGYQFECPDWPVRNLGLLSVIAFLSLFDEAKLHYNQSGKIDLV